MPEKKDYILSLLKNGMFYFGRNDHGFARLYWEKVLEIEPGNRHASEYLEFLDEDKLEEKPRSPKSPHTFSLGESKSEISSLHDAGRAFSKLKTPYPPKKRKTSSMRALTFAPNDGVSNSVEDLQIGSTSGSLEACEDELPLSYSVEQDTLSRAWSELVKKKEKSQGNETSIQSYENAQGAHADEQFRNVTENPVVQHDAQLRDSKIEHLESVYGFHPSASIVEFQPEELSAEDLLPLEKQSSSFNPRVTKIQRISKRDGFDLLAEMQKQDNLKPDGKTEEVETIGLPLGYPSLLNPKSSLELFEDPKHIQRRTPESFVLEKSMLQDERASFLSAGSGSLTASKKHFVDERATASIDLPQETSLHKTAALAKSLEQALVKEFAGEEKEEVIVEVAYAATDEYELGANQENEVGGSSPFVDYLEKTIESRGHIEESELFFKKLESMFVESPMELLGSKMLSSKVTEALAFLFDKMYQHAMGLYLKRNYQVALNMFLFCKVIRPSDKRVGANIKKLTERMKNQ